MVIVEVLVTVIFCYQNELDIKQTDGKCIWLSKTDIKKFSSLYDQALSTRSNMGSQMKNYQTNCAAYIYDHESDNNCGDTPNCVWNVRRR